MGVTKGSSSRAKTVGTGCEEVVGRDDEGVGSFMSGTSESARPQLSLRLARLLRLSEGKRDGELGVPGMVVAEVGMSSMADEEEECVWSVSTDIVVTDLNV